MDPSAPAQDSVSSLAGGLALVGQVRKDNPNSGLDAMSDVEAAKFLHDQTGDDRLLPLIQSSAVARGVHSFQGGFDATGKAVGDVVGGAAGPEVTPRRVVGRAVGNAVAGIPGLAAGVASATLEGVPSALAALGGAGYTYAANKAETGDTKAALGSAGGYLASLGGAIKGAGLGEELAGAGAGGLKKFASGTVGAMAGSLPGDYLGQVTQPGEDATLSKFREDPLNLPAYALSQPLVGGAMEAAHAAAGTRKSMAEATKAATPDLADIVTPSDADELVRLQAKPVQTRTELDLAKMKDLKQRLADVDEAKLADKAPPPAFPGSVSDTLEVPATLKAQVHLLNNSKKAVVQVPAGSELPNIPSYMQKYNEYSSPTDSNLYLYDASKTNPDQIENAIKTNSLGHLLGYGTAGVPADPNGSIATLRSARGTEKAAVVLSDSTQNAVLDALKKQALGDDVVNVETPEQVLDWRKNNAGMQKMFSLAKGEDTPSQDDTGFTNHVLDMFGKSLVGTDRKGARFQPDANGEIGGKGLLKAIDQWAPKDLMDHYKAQGIETLLGSNKVKTTDFTNWLRQNTPEIEVKKLVPAQIGFEQSEGPQIQHQLETMGYTVELNDEEYGGSSVEIVKTPAGEEFKQNGEYAPEAQKLINRLQEIAQKFDSASGDESSDAATGKYGVEPKALEDMPGAVDMLVRVPQKLVPPEEANKGGFIPGAVKDGKVAEAPLFRGPHFGGSDVNVLASVRGYIENHPTLGKIFHVFEVQSDWGQKATQVGVKKEVDPYKLPEGFRLADLREKTGSTSFDRNGVSLYRTNSQGREGLEGQFTSKEEATKAAVRIYNQYRVEGHPLLGSYESLGLKAAIQHARELGITKLAVSDAETAMMTEGHDRVQPDPDYTQADWDRDNPGKEADFRPKESDIEQARGMRAAYDERLPNIMRKLTGDKGQPVDFGRNQNADNYDIQDNIGSPIFKNSDGTPKTNVTTRVFDISNPRPEVRRLFSLYDADQQSSLEHTIAKELGDIISDKRRQDELTPKSLLERSIGGQQTDNDAYLKFVASIKGERGVLREENFMGTRVTATMDELTHDITFNRNVTLHVNEAVRVLAHELTHGAIFDLKRSNPEAYQYLVQLTNNLGFESRLSILQGLKDKLKLGDKFDPSYLSGQKFDPRDPALQEKIAHEFSAGVIEGVTQAHLDSLAKPSWLRYIPAPVLKVLEGVGSKLSKMFGKESPSIGNMLADPHAKRLSEISRLLNEHVISERDANVKALFDLHKTGVFDETTFPDRLPGIDKEYAEAIKSTRGGVGDLHSFASDVAKGAGVVKDKLSKFYEDNFYSGLFRARTKPYTADFFWAMHKMRPTTQAEIYGYHSFLGQLPDGSLSREQSLERAGKFLESLTNPFNSRRDKILNAFSKVFEENTSRREAALNEGGEVKPEQLVSTKEMMSEYGLSSEEAEYAQRFVKIPELVAAESARKAESVDTINISKMFLRANPEQDINGVKARVLRLNRIANDFGAKRYESDYYDRTIKSEQRKAQPNDDLIKTLQQKLGVLGAQEKQFKILMDQNIRQEFAGSIPIKDGPDPFVNGVSEAMVRQAALRFNQKFITKDPGYAPMTRRGRFLLRVYEPSELGEEFGKVKEMRGFDNERSLDQYVKDNAITQFEKIDKETLKGRAQVFTPDKLKAVRDRAKAELGELVAQFSKSSKGDMPEMQRQALLSVLNDFEHSFQPLEDEIKNVVSVQGDKFKERRYLVPGFDRNDYLPNIFEYMDYKTVSGNKEIAKAEGALQMERKEIVADPELGARMVKELNYNLSNQSEFSAVRKAIYYYYLGASVRHIVQYAVQVPLNGISQMVADKGTGLDAYSHFGRGALMAARYSLKGTTGDKIIDVLLKQAQKDGVSLATAIEAPLHETSTIQNALDAISARHEGSMGYGEKLSFAGTQLAKGFEKFLMATSSASDEANKKTTFIASILADRKAGITDPKDLYSKATDFTNFVNFVGDKPNRPGYLIKEGSAPMHGPLLLLSTLQSFVINHISQLASFYKKGFTGGSINDKKAFYTGVAHLLAFSGSMGMVGASLAEQLFQEITDVSLRTAFRKGMVRSAMNLSGEDDPHGSAAHVADRLSDGILYGIPGIMGIDSSDSIGLGDPFFRYQAGEPITAETLGGAGAGILGRVAQAAHDVKVDPFNPQQWFSAIRTGAPAFIANSIKAYDALNTGSTLSSKGEPVGEPLGVAGSASALMGFAPMQTSKERDFQTQVYDQTKLHAEDYQRNVVNVSRLLAEYERTGDQQTLMRANDLFSRYIDSVSGLQDRDEMVNSISDQVRAMQGKVTSPASLKESSTRQGLETAFPSVTSHYPSQVSSELGRLTTASLLGQDDVLARKIRSLPSGLAEKALTDALMSTGVRPEQVQQFLQPSNVLKLGPAR